MRLVQVLRRIIRQLRHKQRDHNVQPTQQRHNQKWLPLKQRRHHPIHQHNRARPHNVELPNRFAKIHTPTTTRQIRLNDRPLHPRRAHEHQTHQPQRRLRQHRRVRAPKPIRKQWTLRNDGQQQHNPKQHPPRCNPRIPLNQLAKHRAAKERKRDISRADDQPKHKVLRARIPESLVSDKRDAVGHHRGPHRPHKGDQQHPPEIRNARGLDRFNDRHFGIGRWDRHAWVCWFSEWWGTGWLVRWLGGWWGFGLDG